LIEAAKPGPPPDVSWVHQNETCVSATNDYYALNRPGFQPKMARYQPFLCMDKPLISFALACYNQEAFIREAVEGAFSQTYSPLEIVISDDCSKDRTFDIVRDLAQAYKGPHTVTLNRNSGNLGIGAHLNRLMELCHGELVVLAAGDDISIAERTAVVVQAWNDSGRKATALSSGFVVIDKDGRVVQAAMECCSREEKTRVRHEQGSIRGFLRRRIPHVAGCAYAISRELFSVFGPVPETVTYEDTANCFRTVLAGGLFTFIDTPLVQYRRHGRNVTFGLHQVRPLSAGAFEDYQTKQRCELDRFVHAYAGFARDAERAMQQGLIPTAEYQVVKKEILKERRRMELKREILDQDWLARWSIFFRLYCSSIRPRELMTQLPHLLPRSLHRAGVVMLNRARS
jgi:glycosyltransferase involved in cell wall biosynthesis